MVVQNIMFSLFAPFSIFTLTEKVYTVGPSMSASRSPVTYTQPSFVFKENNLDDSRPASPEINVKFTARKQRKCKYFQNCGPDILF